MWSLERRGLGIGVGAQGTVSMRVASTRTRDSGPGLHKVEMLDLCKGGQRCLFRL